MSIPSPLLKYRKMKARKLFTWLFQSQVRSWLGMTLGIWVIASTVYYYWLVSKIAMLETQNKINRTQLKLSVVKQMSVDSPTTYQVPVIPDTEGTLCETIHLSLVCMGKCPRQVTPMLKSLLQHRQNPLHFHMIVDASSHHTISKLFDTWNLPDVKYTCYNAESKLAHVRWVPNSHYSGIFALLKLLYPDILPTTLAQVIVLDSDLTFLCDIAELWALFRNMSRQQLIGVVENESNWYYESRVTRWPALGRGYNTGVVTGSSFHSLYKYLIGVVENESNWYYESTVTRWPALGRGYNTGVMLMDLKKIRTDIDWSILWHDTVINNIPKLKQTALADQDIINAIIKSNPHLVYNISCQYNVQMSTKTLAKNCYGEDKANVKILHWNSPNKHSIKVRDADYFRSIYQSYVNLDGNLLTQKLHRCDRTEPDNNKINYSDLCVSFRSAQRVKLRTHLYYMEYSPPDAEPFDVTLVLQLSMDRLQFLERIVKFWEGPLSAAIYLSDCEVTKLESFIQNSSDALSSRRNIGYHLVYKQDSVHYPVNYLRNVALENVNTPYVFLMDADFVPMAGLYDHLRSSIKLINPYPQKKCLVVAAFETQRYRAVPPRSKQALLARLASAHAAGDVAPFRAREWPRGHRPTNYTRWRTAEAPYEVEWEPDYEPYLVVHWTVPKYDTRFSGFGWNKVSHSVELRAQGYKAVVLPAAFVVHTPHAPSLDISAFRADPHYRICLALLKQEFMEDLKRKYNVTFDDAAKSDALLEQSKNFILNQAKNDEK